MRQIVGMVLFLCLVSGTGTGWSKQAKNEPELPQILFFRASPRVIPSGGVATLEWKTRGVTSVTLNWGTGNRLRGALQKRTDLPPSGTLEVKPQEDTIYVLECNSVIGQACASASITVRVK